MNARVLLLLGALVMISASYADDGQGWLVLGGDGEGWFSYPWVDGVACEGFNCTLSSDPVVNNTPPVVSGGGEGAAGHARYYDLILNILNAPVNPGREVTTSAALLFFGNYAPMQDGVLSYYLVSPSGYRLDKNKVTIREGSSQTTIDYALPLDAEQGTWQFVAVWEPVGLDPVESTTNFVVKENPFHTKWVLIGIGVCLSLAAGLYILGRSKGLK